ncbi:MAG: TrbG/VirB9 family P-type conjugative transfer protein [Pseudomonadota bacterium]
MIRAGTLRLPVAALALATVSPALAPLAAQDDPRLVTMEYDEAQVVRVAGKVNVQATIKFSEDEAIENVAIGDSTSWQVTPNKRASLLFVKPLKASATTNMTVVTSKRTYLFDLVASPKNKPLYVLQFRYPELEAAAEEARIAAKAAAEREEANEVEMAAATDPLSVVDPASLNFAWSSDGDSDLFPARAYDDGNAIFLTWPEGTPIPAILITNVNGEEGPVNFTVRGDTVVVDGVYSELVLRSGRDKATLTNSGPVRRNPRSANAAFAR